MQRVVIVGGPRCGKTTLAGTLAVRPVRHTDDLVPTHEWSAASEVVATWLDKPGPWVVEGVATVRALRKWLEAHSTGTPCDVVHLRFDPFVPLTTRQQGMLEACRTVWLQVASTLVRRGVALR